MQYSQGAPQSFFENPWAFGDDPVGTIVSPSSPSSSRPGQEHRCGHRARQNLTVLSGPSWSSSSLAWSSCRHCSVPLTSCGCPAFATLCSGEKLAVPPCPGRQGWDVASCPRSPGSGSPAHCLPLPAQGPREGLPLVLSLLPASPALASKTPQRLPTWELGDGGSQSPRLTESLLFSISLLGKPPHSSIMSMATGKNLQSIPKKVSAVAPVRLGLSRGMGVQRR